MYLGSGSPPVPSVAPSNPLCGLFQTPVGRPPSHKRNTSTYELFRIPDCSFWASSLEIKLNCRRDGSVTTNMKDTSKLTFSNWRNRTMRTCFKEIAVLPACPQWVNIFKSFLSSCSLVKRFLINVINTIPKEYIAFNMYLN